MTRTKRRSSLAAVVVVTALLGACGSGTTTQTASTTGSSLRCPAPPNPTDPAVDPVALDQSTLDADVGVILTYAAQHPGYHGFRFVNSVVPARIEAAFSGAVEEHRAALRELVPHPGRVDVIAAPHTNEELAAARRGIEADLGPGAVASVGEGWLAVDVELAPGRYDLARRYVEQWGDLVRITMGALPYVPEGCGPQPEPRVCPPLAGLDPATAGLELRISPATLTMRASEQGRAELVVRNVGTERFEIDSGKPIVGQLVRLGTTEAVGSYAGVSEGVGGGVRLAPGEEGAIPVIFGAARCDGQPGSALPPGQYGLRVVLTEEGRPTVGRPAYLSPEAVVTITE